MLFYPVLGCYNIYAILSYAMLSYSIPFYAILLYSILCYAILFYSILCYAILFNSILCFSILFHLMLCYPTLFHPTLSYPILLCPYLSYPVLFHPMLYCVMLCFLILVSLSNLRKGHFVTLGFGRPHSTKSDTSMRYHWLVLECQPVDYSSVICGTC